MSVFRFQQFSVRQNQSAMKVCTDSVLFGAMAPVKCNDRVLDIGAGTGVLSLMAAQLGAGTVTAVELTKPAYLEAKYNFGQSPWSDRLTISHQAIQDFAAMADQPYDLAICNPPFFENHSKTSDPLRMAARHNDQLAYADLINCADKLLTPQGLLYLLIPLAALAKIVAVADTAGFYLIRQTEYQAFEHSNAKVAALLFSRNKAETAKYRLIIYRQARVYTQQSTAYLRSFLLRFADTDAGMGSEGGHIKPPIIFTG